MKIYQKIVQQINNVKHTCSKTCKNEICITNPVLSINISQSQRQECNCISLSRFNNDRYEMPLKKQFFAHIWDSNLAGFNAY